MGGDELVDLYDDEGAVTGTALRSRVRSQNLRHGATAVLVRDRLGRVYVHRRTTTKDLYPGLLDFAAGGVLLAGESPHEGARREAEEELGVAGATLQAVGEGDYTDAFSDYRAFRYTATYDGPIRWQAEEVSWGEWFTVDALQRWVEQEPHAFVPDSRALWRRHLEAWAADRVELTGGWDNATTLVEGLWVDRTPRRHDLAGRLLAETRLLRAIAHRMPLQVPDPRVVEHNPLVVRHRLVAGQACDPAGLTRADGLALGRFLTALHTLPASVGREHAVPPASEDRGARARLVARFRRVVLPFVAPSQLAGATALLDEVSTVGEQALCHGDLTREHLIVRYGALAGVIDWGEVRVTDPALDLAWPLCGTTERFVRGLTEGYPATPEQARRARAWFTLVPWHAAHRALLHRDPDADAHLAQVAQQLRRWPGPI